MQNYRVILLNLFFGSFLIFGALSLKDYGMGIEENFHRASGFYWLKYIFSFTNFEELKNIIDIKINEIYSFNENLPLVKNNLSYGILLDVPVALLEILLNFKTNAYNIYLKHFFSFFIFFISGICFYLLLSKIFTNFYPILFGTLFYFLNPKILGASFFDGKDLFYLSIFTISIYTYVLFEKKKTKINLILFALFSAFATSSRIIGLIIPVSFLLLTLLKLINDKNYQRELKTLIVYLIFFLYFY